MAGFYGRERDLCPVPFGEALWTTAAPACLAAGVSAAKRGSRFQNRLRTYDTRMPAPRIWISAPIAYSYNPNEEPLQTAGDARSVETLQRTSAGLD